MQNETAGVGLRGCRAIQGGFEHRDQIGCIGPFRTGIAGGRHGPRTQLADYLFPDLAVGVNVGQVRLVELGVAGYAVLVEERTRIGGACKPTAGNSEKDDTDPFCGHGRSPSAAAAETASGNPWRRWTGRTESLAPAAARSRSKFLSVARTAEPLS